MTRPKFRRTLRLENLESRELLASGGPSAQQQYMLELLNLARTSPATIAEKVTTNLDADVQATVKHYQVDLNQVRSAIASTPAKPPLAWNTKLADAAQGHSQDQANTGTQSHSGSDGSDVSTRLERAGYRNRTTAGENAFAYSASVDEAMEAFLIDWGVANNGHRANILQPDTPQENAYRDVGIGIVDTQKPSPVGPVVITQNFGAQADAKAQLIGVAYNDPDNKNFYEPGQGRGDVTIDAVNEATGAKASVQTWDSGGYQIPLDPGKYQVTARVGDQVVRSQDVDINKVNVKVDYDLSEPWQGTPPVTSVPPQMMLLNTEAPATPTDAPKAEAQPVTLLMTENAKSDDAASATPSTSAPQADVIQVDTESDHEAVAPPTTPDSDFDQNWMTWKAKKSA